MLPPISDKDRLAARAGAVTMDKIVQAAFLRGQGHTYAEIAKALDIRNLNALITAVKAAGIGDVAHPGMRELRVLLSNARYADVAAMTRQAGYGLEEGVSEFLGVAAKDRTIRTTLERARR